MLSVSDPARELLRDVDLPDDRVLRLEPQDNGGLTFVAGSPAHDDQVVEDQGREVLHIAAPVSQQLDGQLLDRVETAEGPRLTIRAPEDSEL
jgi:iron-sulfur cluster assembly protein